MRSARMIAECSRYRSGILPQRAADAILALLRRVRVAHAEPRAVGVEADHVDLAGDVDRRLEAIGLGEQQHRRIAAVAGAVHAEAIGIGDAHVDQLVGRGGHALGPRLARAADDEVHGRVEHRVAVIGEKRRAAR